jgi:hypothetical protein
MRVGWAKARSEVIPISLRERFENRIRVYDELSTHAKVRVVDDSSLK